jgi:MerR family regulatory protein
VSGFDFERTQSLSVVSVATTQLLNSLIARADQDGLPDLSELLARQVDVDDAAAFPLTVGEVAELLGVSGHTLRYYERIGLVDVGRSVSGQRRYDRAALGAGPGCRSGTSPSTSSWSRRATARQTNGWRCCTGTPRAARLGPADHSG